jgi:hypothetical protein
MQLLWLSWGLSHLMRADGSEREEGHVDEQLTVDASASAWFPDAENPLAEVASARETAVGDTALEPRRFGVIDHRAVCGLLME